MNEGIHYMPFHKVTGISFNNMTCLMSMKIVEMSSNMKGYTHAQIRASHSVLRYLMLLPLNR